MKILCASSCIIFLQKTQLTNYDIQLLTTISNAFNALDISSIDSSIHLLAGRPHVGLRILWRKSLFSNSAHNIAIQLDHILTTSTGRDLIEHIYVVNNIVSFHHLPLLLLLTCECFHVMEHNEFNLILCI